MRAILSSWYRQTLVLYRMRPTVSVQVGWGSFVGRVRYSCLKEAAHVEAFMQIQMGLELGEGLGK